MAKFNFTTFDEQITEKRFAVLDNVFSSHELVSLRNFLNSKKDHFHKAKIGRNESKILNQEIRSDEIFWIENWQENDVLRDYNELLCEIMTYIKMTFFLPLKRFESHFACYPKGSFYKKHLDRHKDSPHRQITIVLYLNDLEIADGGELVLYPDQDSQGIKINPKEGRLAIFITDNMIHEVLPTAKERYSITTWMRDDE